MSKSFLVWMSGTEGLGKVHLVTGTGKGKTTAAFGLAMRAAGHGLKVCVIQFLKTGETTGEVLYARKAGGIEIAQFGTGGFVDPKHIAAEDRSCARDALRLAKDILAKGDCNMLVLDEVNVAVSFGLISSEEVLSLLRSRREGTEVVLTGRNAPIEFIEYADYVSIIESRKNPFDDGHAARKGIEW
jgi:cob(I)alamin adenosyltransferase